MELFTPSLSTSPNEKKSKTIGCLLLSLKICPVSELKFITTNTEPLLDDIASISESLI